VANAADILAAFAEIHADFFGRFQGNDLTDVME
jgi:hypothetical protein